VTFDPRRPGDRALRVGHRGAAALAPENTIASFERAVEVGVDGIELDVVSPEIGKLTVCHETNGNGPALDEALAFVADRQELFVQVDVKSEGFEAAVVEALRRHELVDRALVSSFHASSLRAFAALEPRLTRSFTYPEDRLGLASRVWLRPAVRGAVAAIRRALPRRAGALLDRAQANALTIHFTVFSPALAAACHARGTALWVWTVNDAEAAASLAAAGADAIITDDPRIFRTDSAPGSS
jgi:glycerophosphoryl diester phosphodiesterase